MNIYVDRGEAIHFNGLWIPKDPKNSDYKRYLEQVQRGEAKLVSYVPSWDEIRVTRNNLLSQSDWAVMPDANPKPSKDAWITYRNALRNIPQNFATTDTIIWPMLPA